MSDFPGKITPNEYTNDPISALKNEVNKSLSVQEQANAYEEIHGIAPLVLETKEIIHKSLFEFQTWLDKTNPKSAYELAFSMNADYVQNAKFRIMFLRSTSFHVRDAVNKFIFFFEEKLKLFGKDTLTRSLKLSDLDEQDLETLREGWLQLLPQRDSAGRAVLFKAAIKNFLTVNGECKVKSSFYRVMSFIESDEETQKLGMVSVLYRFEDIPEGGSYIPGTNKKKGGAATNIHKVIWAAARMMQLLPVRMQSVHICVPPIQVPKKLLGLFMTAASKHLRARIRIHQGSDCEINYTLMTYGIPMKVIPVTHNGKIKTKLIQQWVAQRQVLEAQKEANNDNGDNNNNDNGISFNLIELPGQSDILVGKGMPLQNHPGNVRYLQIIERHLHDYTRSSAPKKKQLAKKVLQEIQTEPGVDCVRFLERDENGWWVEVTDNAILLRKVTKRFANLMKLEQQNKEKKEKETTHANIHNNNNILEPLDVHNEQQDLDALWLFAGMTYRNDFDNRSCLGCFNSVDDGKRQRISDW